MTGGLTASRKDDHIRINLEEDISFETLTSGLEQFRFVHQALPDLDLEAIDTPTVFLKRRLAFPLIIASMTGGTPDTARINQILAEAAQTAGIGMGLGSTRAALERPEVGWTFQVRDCAPDILLLANLGAVQLNYGYGVDHCRRIVDIVQADALILHLNPLQEALQPEGNTRFDGLIRKIEAVCRALPAPVVVKEVGWGLSGETARQLIDAGVAALDVAGAGGTSWSQVEMYRANDPVQREVAASFRDWGLTTVESIQNVRRVAPEIPLIASGGLRDGIDVAKALALGADVASMAGPVLRAALDSPKALHDQLETVRRQLHTAMFATGARDIAALKQVRLLHTPRT